MQEVDEPVSRILRDGLDTINFHRISASDLVTPVSFVILGRYSGTFWAQ
jgi:hypothetical protein